MAKNTEIELKLLLSKEDLERLLTLDFMVQAVREGSRRVRFEATVKTQKQSAGGLSERLELNLPLAEAQPVLDGFAALGLGFELSELAPCGVQALFTVDVQRITYILDYAGAVCELAIDKGAIRCGEKSDSIDEVEIELLEGEVQALLELKERIAAAVTLRAEERSKFARGLALLQG